MKKRIALTKNGLYVVCMILLAIVIGVVIIFGRNTSSSDKKEVKKDKEVLESVVMENTTLKVKLLDFVNEKNYQDKYQECKIVIDKNEKVASYKISNKQVFTKVMKLLPPDNSTIRLNQNSEKPTDMAYVLVLTGDIAKYKVNNKVEYRIINARIDYYQQYLTLESDYNSIYIASLDGTKEKLVKLDEYKKVLNQVDKYRTMLDW